METVQKFKQFFKQYKKTEVIDFFKKSVEEHLNESDYPLNNPLQAALK